MAGRIFCLCLSLLAQTVSSGSHGPDYPRHAHAKRVCRWPWMAGGPSSSPFRFSPRAICMCPHTISAVPSCVFTGPAGFSIHRTYCPVSAVPDNCGAWPKG